MKAADLVVGIYGKWRVPQRDPVSAYVARSSRDDVVHLYCSDESRIISSPRTLEAQGLLEHFHALPPPKAGDLCLFDDDSVGRIERIDDGNPPRIIVAISDAVFFNGHEIRRPVTNIRAVEACWWGTRVRRNPGTLDEQYQGIMIDYMEQEHPGGTRYPRSIPGWECRHCGNKYGTAGLPPRRCWCGSIWHKA